MPKVNLVSIKSKVELLTTKGSVSLLITKGKLGLTGQEKNRPLETNIRITQDGDTRILENGDTRILNGLFEIF
jgi:hypothetical protein